MIQEGWDILTASQFLCTGQEQHAHAWVEIAGKPKDIWDSRWRAAKLELCDPLDHPIITSIHLEILGTLIAF